MLLSTTRGNGVWMILVTGSIFLLSTVCALNTAEAGVAVDCEGSAQAYRAQGIPCDCKGGRIVCDDSSSGGSSSGKKSGGLSYKNQMKLEIMQSVADMAANAFIRWLNEPAPSQRQPSPEEQAAIRAQHEKELAEWEARVQKKILEMETEYAEQERQAVKVKSSRLLSNLKGLDGNASAPRSELLDQLRCKAYWGRKAAEEADESQARTFGQLAENPDDNALTECAEALPEPPMPAAPNAFSIDLYQTIVEEINQRLPLIEQAREQQRNAQSQWVEKQQQVDTLKARQEQAPSPAEKQATDDLLAAALQELDAATMLKKEADAGVMKLQLEIDAFKNVEKLAANADHSSSGKGPTP